MNQKEFKKLNEERARMISEIDCYAWENDWDKSVLPKFSRVDLEETGSPEWVKKFNEIKIAYSEFKNLTYNN